MAVSFVKKMCVRRLFLLVCVAAAAAVCVSAATTERCGSGSDGDHSFISVAASAEAAAAVEAANAAALSSSLFAIPSSSHSRHSSTATLEYRLSDDSVSVLVESAVQQLRPQLFLFDKDVSVGEVLNSKLPQAALHRSHITRTNGNRARGCSVLVGGKAAGEQQQLRSLLATAAKAKTAAEAAVELRCPVTVPRSLLQASSSTSSATASTHAAAATFLFRSFSQSFPSTQKDDALSAALIEEQMDMLKREAEKNPWTLESSSAPAATAAAAKAEEEQQIQSLIQAHSTVNGARSALARREPEVASPEIASLYPTLSSDYANKVKWAAEGFAAKLQALQAPATYPSWRGVSGRFDGVTGAAIASGTRADALPRGAKVKIGLVADWASGTVESDYVGYLMATENGQPDWTVGAGDVYFTGSSESVLQNCLGRAPREGMRGVTWPHGRLGSFATLGNHELYNKGEGFFKTYQPTLGTASVRQQAPYASIETADWRVLMLDTGYGSYLQWGTNQPADKTDMPSSLYRWLESELRLSDPNDKRGLLVITHHQPNSAFDEPYLLPAKGIADRLPKERKFLWLYGHEHKMAFYDWSPIVGARGGRASYLGRCVGNSGFPTNLVPVARAPAPVGSGKLLGYDSRVYQKMPLSVDADTKNKDDGIAKSFNGWVDIEINGREMVVTYKTLALDPVKNYATNTHSDWFAKETLSVDSEGNVIQSGKLTFNPNAKGASVVDERDPTVRECASAFDLSCFEKIIKDEIFHHGHKSMISTAAAASEGPVAPTATPFATAPTAAVTSTPSAPAVGSVPPAPPVSTIPIAPPVPSSVSSGAPPPSSAPATATAAGTMVPIEQQIASPTASGGPGASKRSNVESVYRCKHNRHGKQRCGWWRQRIGADGVRGNAGRGGSRNARSSPVPVHLHHRLGKAKGTNKRTKAGAHNKSKSNGRGRAQSARAHSRTPTHTPRTPTHTPRAPAHPASAHARKPKTSRKRPLQP